MECAAGSSAEENVLQFLDVEQNTENLSNALIYCKKLLQDANLIVSSPSTQISPISIAMGEEFYNTILDMLAERTIIIDEDLIAFNETDEEEKLTAAAAATTAYDPNECCWRCTKQRGHTWFDCRRIPHRFCSQCGKDRVLTKDSSTDGKREAESGRRARSAFIKIAYWSGPVLRVRIKGHDCEALLDTGSALSLINGASTQGTGGVHLADGPEAFRRERNQRSA